jgi:L,D-transpeptidase ErfK/SrfK
VQRAAVPSGLANTFTSGYCLQPLSFLSVCFSIAEKSMGCRSVHENNGNFGSIKNRRIFFILFFLLAFSGAERARAADRIEGDLVGNITHYKVRPEDTLYKISRQFDIGIVRLLTANPGVDPWAPRPGTNLIVPTEYVLPAIRSKGVIINLSEMRLFYFPDAHTVMTFPVGIGKSGWETLTGNTTIVEKRKNPAWIPPDSIRKEDPNLPEIILPGPNNPLGQYALNLGFNGYRIHGTNSPNGIGRRSSHGCIRLYPEDIAALFPAVETGTPVTIIDRPYKLGWRQDKLFLEVTPAQQQSDAIMQRKPMEIVDIPEVYGDIKSMAHTENIDWRAVHEAVMWRSGIPVAIATRASM